MGRLIDADNAYCVLTVNYNHHTDIQHKALKECLDRVKTEEAISIGWIEAEIKKLKAMDFEFATLTAEMIEAMLEKWKKEQEHEIRRY